jgi:YidC/Oxa1 family membrane protein insertase
LHVLLAASFLDPIVNFMSSIILQIHRVIPNLGVCLVVFAALIRLVFWGLNTSQFKAMIAMQKVAPRIKKLQERYGKNDPQKLQQETMALYKESGANPLAGCLPMLVQYPFIISVYYVVTQNKVLYDTTSFLWVGSPLAAKFPAIFGASLAAPDLILVALYALSMYVSMRFTTMPPTDPAQAQQMKIMQVVMPLMLGFLGFKYHWPSAMVLYWFSSNLFTMGQQLYLLRRYHQPLSAIDADHAILESVPAASAPAALPSTNGVASTGSRRKRKKGAKK